jgi:hypothetical protein
MMKPDETGSSKFITDADAPGAMPQLASDDDALSPAISGPWPSKLVVLLRWSEEERIPCANGGLSVNTERLS